MVDYIDKEQLEKRIRKLHSAVDESMQFSESISGVSATLLERNAVLGVYRQLGELRGLYKLHDDYFDKDDRLVSLRNKTLGSLFDILEAILFESKKRENE